MLFRRTRLFFQQLFRLLEILKVIIRHSFREWVSQRRIARRIFWFVNKKNKVVSSAPERLRIAIEELGPTFIKFGQILADRPDLISANFRKELKKLQSAAKPFSDEAAISIIETETGEPIDSIFKTFDRKHIASASIGQVDAGVLMDGSKVAVKIQRPNILKKIKLDLLLLNILAKKLVKRYPDLAVMDVSSVVEEFGHSLFNELDYLTEASNIMRFQQMFEKDDRIHIPKVYHQFTTSKVLFMEFISGISPDKLDKLEEAGIDKKVIASNGADILLIQILKNGFFHADPHAGNIFILPGNVISFIDYGMVGTLKQRHINFIAEFTLGLVRKDSRALANAMLKLSNRKYFDQMEELEFEMSKILQRFAYLPVSQLQIGQVLQESINVISKFQLHIPSSFFMLMKSIATIEKFAVDLDPNLALVSVMKKHAIDILKKRYGLKHMASSLYHTIGDYINLVQDFPGEVNEILYKMKEGKLIHEIEVKDKDLITQTTAKLINRLSAVLLLGFLMIGSIILYIWGDVDHRISKIFFSVTALISFVLIFRWGFKSRIKK